MADRRTDDSPLVPRRPLGVPTQSEETSDQATGRRHLSERVSAAIATASTSVSSGTRGDKDKVEGGPRKRPDSPTAAAQRPQSAPSRPKGTRKARLRLSHIDPWSVMKTAFLLSIAFGIVTVVSVAVVWSVLGAAGVWDSINKSVQDVLGGEAGSTFDVTNYVGTERVMGFTMIVAVVDVILITAIATLGAFLYNLAAALLGGVEVTLAEDEQ